MKSLPLTSSRALEASPRPLSESRVLLRAALVAFFVETAVLTGLGIRSHWLAHPQVTGLDPTKFIETQMMELPTEEHLVEKEPVKAQARTPEPVLSKVANRGRKAKPEDQKLPESNQTHSPNQDALNLGPTHGPVAVFSPPPVIPAYLQTQDLRRTVAIEFFVNAQGGVTPRLLSSSGNEELDAIAIAAVKKWQFRPAEQDHKAVDAKVKLRIVFDVH